MAHSDSPTSATYGTGLVEVDVEVGRLVGRGELVEVLEVVADAPGAAGRGRATSRNVSPASRSSAKRPTTRTTASGARLGRQLQWPSRRTRSACLADVAAEQHLVAGRGLAVGAALDAEEADVGDVVLAAGVGAAGDVDAHAADLGEAGLLERVADGGGEAAATA